MGDKNETSIPQDLAGATNRGLVNTKASNEIYADALRDAGNDEWGDAISNAIILAKAKRAEQQQAGLLKALRMQLGNVSKSSIRFYDDGTPLIRMHPTTLQKAPADFFDALPHIAWVQFNEAVRSDEYRKCFQCDNFGKLKQVDFSNLQDLNINEPNTWEQFHTALFASPQIQHLHSAAFQLPTHTNMGNRETAMRMIADRSALNKLTTLIIHTSRAEPGLRSAREEANRLTNILVHGKGLQSLSSLWVDAQPTSSVEGGTVLTQRHDDGHIDVAIPGEPISPVLLSHLLQGEDDPLPNAPPVVEYARPHLESVRDIPIVNQLVHARMNGENALPSLESINGFTLTELGVPPIGTKQSSRRRR